MSKTNTTNHRDPASPSTRSQYHTTLVAVMLLCILTPNSGAASESTPLIDYTISASPSPETPIVVDDDPEVKVNGETVFIDDDGYATLDGRASWKGDLITFSALPGDEREDKENGGHPGAGEGFVPEEHRGYGGFSIPNGYVAIPVDIVDDLRKDSAKYKNIWPNVLQMGQNYNNKIIELTRDGTDTTHYTTELDNYQNQFFKTLENFEKPTHLQPPANTTKHWNIFSQNGNIY